MPTVLGMPVAQSGLRHGPATWTTTKQNAVTGSMRDLSRLGPGFANIIVADYARAADGRPQTYNPRTNRADRDALHDTNANLLGETGNRVCLSTHRQYRRTIRSQCFEPGLVRVAEFLELNARSAASMSMGIRHAAWGRIRRR
jgi:hypothetical protein